MRRANLLIATLTMALGVFIGAQPASAIVTTRVVNTGADDHPSLPDGPGRDVMIRVCSQCHEPELAADQQFDRAGWKDLVDKMASKGANATEAEFDQIVTYLAKSFPAK